jgi:hypothetical protein
VTPLDLATGTAGTPIVVGQTPVGVTVTADGSTAYVTTWGDGSTPSALTAIDVASGAVGSPIPLGILRYPASVVVTADETTAFVSTQGDDSIVPIDLGSGVLGTPIAVATNPFRLALTPDETRLYATHYPIVPDGLGDPESRDVTPVDLATRTPLSQIAVGFQTYGIAITGDGTTAFVAHAGEAFVDDDGALSPIDLATATAGAAIPLGGEGGAVAIRPAAAPPDTTPPTLAPTVRGSGPGGAVLLNDPAPVAEPNADDGSGSGVASASCDQPDVTSVGVHTLTCSATDVAGNSRTVDVSYVVEYRLVGLAPADGTTARTGRPLQIRVSLADASGALVGACDVCTVSFQAFAVGGSGQNAGPFEMRYHGASQQFRYSWRPASSGAGTTRVTVAVSYPGTASTTAASALITLT